MPSKLIYNKANYILCCYIGNGSGLIGWLKTKFWTWRVKRLSEGEILNRYYELTGKDRFDYE